MKQNKNINIIVCDNETAPFPSGNYSLVTYQTMNNKAIKKYVTEITNALRKNVLPVSKCVQMIHLEYNHNPCFFVSTFEGNDKQKPHWHPLDSAFDDKLNIKIILDPKNCKCGCAKCARNLMYGDCADEFVKKVIGKIFFPDRYQNQR